MNAFDAYQEAAFDVVSNTMGYDASWTPSAGGPTQTCKALLKNPTEAQAFQPVGHELPEYNPHHWMMEYRQGNFEGLKVAVDSNEVEEVTVNGQTFNVSAVYTKFDGKTYYAILVPIST